MNLTDLEKIITHAFANPNTPDLSEKEILSSIETCLHKTQSGEIRVAEPDHQGIWRVNQWVKQGILLAFRHYPTQVITGEISQYFDKLPLQFAQYTQSDFERHGARIVPPAAVRMGAYIAPKTVIMPSYINIGAYVDSGTLIDTWATVGSCAQIGKNVHISGGVGIGGVLEPLQANPTIIEDNCFIGARSEIVEGVIIEKNSVISMGVFIGQSTRIFDRETGEITYGRVPAGSVVVSGTLPDKNNQYDLYAAIIVKKVDEKTRSKVSINELLRN